jgi:hypothetical protein
VVECVGVDSEEDGGLHVGELGEGGRGGVGSVSSKGEGKVGVHARGESCSFLSSVLSLSNSTSQHCFTAFLVRFAGGGEVAGSMIGWRGWPSQQGERGSEVRLPQELAVNWQVLAAN